MGKRKGDEEYYKRKIRKMESKLRKLQDSRNNSDEEPSSQPPPPPPPQTKPPSSMHVHKELLEAIVIEDDFNIPIDDDQLPEELLLALGKEGEEKEEIGELISPELATRWTKIMAEGLGKEARTNILSKYHTPSNFPNEIAPIMNPEIMATLSELSIKRDQRIVTRQNLTGKLMTCLGRSLSSILKGNISTVSLVEEINDAAKIAAEIHFQDSSSRKFFALSGSHKTIQDTFKNTKVDKFLFGADCADKIKIAQSIQKTSAQITGITLKNKYSNYSEPKDDMNEKDSSQNHKPQDQARKGQGTKQQPQYRRQPRQPNWRSPAESRRSPARSRASYTRYVTRN